MDDVFIVKIGGSLISDKDGYCAADVPAIRGFARAIGASWSVLCRRLILVIGGGSFGNAVPRRFRLTSFEAGWSEADVAVMTLTMFRWLSLVCDELREERLPAYPFQTSGYLVTRDGVPAHFCVEPVKRALALGLLPVLSGDLVFDEHRGFVIFSSDAVPGLFVDQIPIRRAVMLTDVPGVLRRHGGSSPGELLRVVSRDNHAEVLREAGPSGRQDVTGGMSTKLHALVGLAREGVEGVICDGSDPARLLSALLDDPPRGTLVEAWGPNVTRRRGPVC